MTENYVFTNHANTSLPQAVKLRPQDKIFSQVLNSIDAVVYVTDMKTHEIVFINAYGKNIWGDVKGKICWQVFQDEQIGPCEFCTNHELVGPDGSPAEGVFREIRNTVNKRWYDCRNKAIYWPDGRIVRLGIATDITERKQIEQKNSESQERLREVLENALDASYKRNMQTNTYDYLSPVFTRISGFTPDEMKELSLESVLDLIHPDDSPEIERVLAESMAGASGAIYQVQYRFKHRNGQYRWFLDRFTCMRDAAGKPLACIGSLSDITDQKRNEEALRESEARYHLLFESAADALFLISRDTGMILDANIFASELYGYDPAELFTKKSWDLSAEPEETRRLTQQALGVPDKVLSIPLRLHRKKDGTVFPVEITSRSFPLFGQKVLLVAARDITERRLAEAEKAELEGQRRKLQKAESLARMAGAIAHHFNNQLQVVTGNLEMIMDDLPPGSAAQENLAEALKAARKAAEVSSMMITYRGQAPCLQKVLDLSGACRRSLTLLQAAVPKSVVIKADFPVSGPAVRGDSIQIQQVVDSLVTNAWEASGENHAVITLTIKTVAQADIPASNRFPIDWRPEKSVHACLEVTDTGCGIACKDIEKIFDPFFTTKFVGRGMGLPVTLGIVRRHGGGITVQSELGQGSVFRAFLPVSTEAIPFQPDQPAMPGVLRAGELQEFTRTVGGTVLLIEDEEPVRNLARIMLARLGFKVLEAKNGIEAVEIFRQHQEAIGCVLSDLTMPHMDGWETLAALRRLSPGIPIILSSGYDEARVMAGEHPDRPDAFLGKPYQRMELDNTIRRALANKKEQGND